MRPSKPQTPDFESSSDEDEEEENNPPQHHIQNNKPTEEKVKKSPVPKNIDSKEGKSKDPSSVQKNPKNRGKDKAPANLSDSVSSRTRRRNTSMNTSKQK